jgi:hypothetical protein
MIPRSPNPQPTHYTNLVRNVVAVIIIIIIIITIITTTIIIIIIIIIISKSPTFMEI